MSPIPLIDPNETFDVRIGDVTYSLSAPLPNELTRALHRFTKPRPGDKEKVDSDAFNEWYRDRVIKGWKSSTPDQDAPCTLANKMALDMDTWETSSEAIKQAGTLLAEHKARSLGN